MRAVSPLSRGLLVLGPQALRGRRRGRQQTAARTQQMWTAPRLKGSVQGTSWGERRPDDLPGLVLGPAAFPCPFPLFVNPFLGLGRELGRRVSVRLKRCVRLADAFLGCKFEPRLLWVRRGTGGGRAEPSSAPEPSSCHAVQDPDNLRSAFCFPGVSRASPGRQPYLPGGTRPVTFCSLFCLRAPAATC